MCISASLRQWFFILLCRPFFSIALGVLFAFTYFFFLQSTQQKIAKKKKWAWMSVCVHAVKYSDWRIKLYNNKIKFYYQKNTQYGKHIPMDGIKIMRKRKAVKPRFLFVIERSWLLFLIFFFICPDALSISL